MLPWVSLSGEEVMLEGRLRGVSGNICLISRCIKGKMLRIVVSVLG